jgi:tellurite resistance protein
MAGTLADEGWPRRAAYVGEVLAKSALRERAFRLAVAVAMIDDYVANAEAAAIDTLSTAFGFEPEHSDALVKQVYGELFGAS